MLLFNREGLNRMIILAVDIKNGDGICAENGRIRTDEQAKAVLLSSSPEPVGSETVTIQEINYPGAFPAIRDINEKQRPGKKPTTISSLAIFIACVTPVC